MGHRARLSALAVVAVMFAALAPSVAAAAQDQPPATSGAFEVAAFEVTPAPARLGRALRVTGELHGIDTELTGSLLLDGVDLGPVTVSPAGLFEAEVLVPDDATTGGVPLVLDLGSAGAVPLATLVVVESTGIDLSAALSSTLADDEVEETPEAVEEPPPSVAPTTIAAVAPPVEPPPVGIAVLVAAAGVALSLVIAIATAIAVLRRRRREADAPGEVVFKGGKAVAADPADSRPAEMSYRAGDHVTAPPPLSTGSAAKVSRLVDLSVDAGTTFEVVEIIQWLSTSARQERVIARADSLTLAREVMRNAWNDHEPESRSQEAWWEIRRTATASTLWVMHAGSDREFQVDESTR